MIKSVQNWYYLPLKIVSKSSLWTKDIQSAIFLVKTETKKKHNGDDGLSSSCSFYLPREQAAVHMRMMDQRIRPIQQFYFYILQYKVPV